MENLTIQPSRDLKSQKCLYQGFYMFIDKSKPLRNHDTAHYAAKIENEAGEVMEQYYNITNY